LPAPRGINTLRVIRAESTTYNLLLANLLLANRLPANYDAGGGIALVIEAPVAV